MHLFLFLLLFIQAVFADASLEKPVLQGTLENGMAYYVKENKNPKGKAFLQLVVKVGSIHEEDHEQGIAHFLEHLNFRGSEHLPEGEQDRYLDSLGCYDRNAMTGFQNTTYHLELPIEEKGSLDMGLLIMRDFAGFATLADGAIAKERHVVLDEMHQGFSSTERRRFRQLLIANFPESHLVKRFPIGTEEVISKVTPETLRTFYKKWYRPDRMAILVVGDFDGREVVSRIQKLFGPIVNPKQKPVEPDLGLVFPVEDRQVIYFDPELDQTGVELIFASPAKDMASASAHQRIKEEMLRKCLVNLFSSRLDAAREEGYFYDFSLNPEFLQSVDHLFVEVNFFERGAKEGVSSLFREIERVKALGFSPSELEEWKEIKKIGLERELANVDKLDHQSSIDGFVKHFYHKEKSLLTEGERYKLALEVIDSITLEELNASISDSLLAKPCVALFSTSSKELKEEFEAKSIFTFRKSQEDLLPFNSKKVELIIEPSFPAGFIQASKTDTFTGVTEWTLSNGIKVLLKKTDLDRDRVYVSTIAKGGIAQFSPEEFPSAGFADWGLEGLKGLSSYEKKLFLEDRGVKVKDDIAFGSRSIDYEVGSRNIETVFQVIHSVFTDPRFEQKSWDKEVCLLEDLQKQGQKKPAAQFARFVKKITTGDHFTFQKTDLSKVNQEMAKKAFHTLFGQPRDFTFIVVGDFDHQVVADFVKKYIASLPTGEKGLEKPLFLPSQALNEKIEEEFVLGRQSQALCSLNFSVDVESIFKRHQSMVVSDGVVKLLRQRLWNVLRAEHGKTYGANVKLATPFSPDLSFAQLQIEFTCLPEDRQFMVELAIQEIEKLKTTEPTAEEIATLKTSYVQNLKEDKLFNRHWLGSLKFAEFFGVDTAKVFDETKGERLLTANKLQETAMTLFSHPNYSVLYHLPEN